MSFQYTILREQQLILVRFSGPASVLELVTATTVICGDPRYVRGMDGLIDLRGVDPAVDTGEIRSLIELTLTKKKHGHGRWAVITATPLSTALTMLYQKGVSPAHPFTVFYTTEGAAAFIGHQLDDDAFNAALVL